MNSLASLTIPSNPQYLKSENEDTSVAWKVGIISQPFFSKVERIGTSLTCQSDANLKYFSEIWIKVSKCLSFILTSICIRAAELKFVRGSSCTSKEQGVNHSKTVIKISISKGIRRHCQLKANKTVF